MTHMPDQISIVENARISLEDGYCPNGFLGPIRFNRDPNTLQDLVALIDWFEDQDYNGIWTCRTNYWALSGSQVIDNVWAVMRHVIRENDITGAPLRPDCDKVMDDIEAAQLFLVSSVHNHLQSLRAWALEKIQLEQKAKQSETTFQASPHHPRATKKNNRAGAPGLGLAEITSRSELCDKWDENEGKRTQQEFADDHGIDVEELRKILNWRSQRVRRKNKFNRSRK